MEIAGPRSPVRRAPDSKVRGPGFDNLSGHILSFLLLLIQEGQLSVTGESMCTKYWLHLGGLSLPRKSLVRLTDHPDMTVDVYRGRKTNQQSTTDGNTLKPIPLASNIQEYLEKYWYTSMILQQFL